MVVNKICPMGSLKGSHNVQSAACLAQACRHWVDIDVALDKSRLSQVVACTVHFLLEPFWGVVRGWGMSSILVQLSQLLLPPNIH